MKFIEKIATVEDGDKSDDMEHDDEEVRNDSDDDFIDDETEFQDQGLSDYRLRNIIMDQQEALQDLSMGEDLGTCNDPENFVLDYFDDTEYEFDEFKNFERKKKKNKKFQGQTENLQGRFCQFFLRSNTIRTFFKLCGGDKKEFVEDETALKDVVGEEFYEELFAKKDSFCLDLNLVTLEHQCQEINYLLIEKCLFLLVYELKKKFRYLLKRDLLQNKVR